MRSARWSRASAFRPHEKGIHRSGARDRRSLDALGLSGGIAPSLVRSVFGLNSGLLNGLSGFIAPATSAVIGVMVAASTRGAR